MALNQSRPGSFDANTERRDSAQAGDYYTSHSNGIALLLILELVDIDFKLMWLRRVAEKGSLANLKRHERSPFQLAATTYIAYRYQHLTSIFLIMEHFSKTYLVEGTGLMLPIIVLFLISS